MNILHDYGHGISPFPLLFLPAAILVIHWTAAPSPAGRPDGGGRSEVEGHLWFQCGLPCHRRGLGQPLRHLHPLTCENKTVLINVCKSSITRPMHLNEEQHTWCKAKERIYFLSFLKYDLLIQGQPWLTRCLMKIGFHIYNVSFLTNHLFDWSLLSEAFAKYDSTQYEAEMTE